MPWIPRSLSPIYSASMCCIPHVTSRFKAWGSVWDALHWMNLFLIKCAQVPLELSSIPHPIIMCWSLSIARRYSLQQHQSCIAYTFGSSSKDWVWLCAT